MFGSVQKQTAENVLTLIAYVQNGGDAYEAAQALLGSRGSAKLLQSIISAAQTIQAEFDEIEREVDFAEDRGCPCGW